MSADLTLLMPEFRLKVITLLQNCAHRGIELRPRATLRDPFIQARYWRQSRPIAEINQKIKDLKANGAHFIADCIHAVGFQQGAHVTNAIPGLSWHQWGEAVDCFWVMDEHAIQFLHTPTHETNGLMIYATEAEKIGLDAGFFWESFRDAPHVQLRKAASPASLYTLAAIDAEMQMRFEQYD